MALPLNAELLLKLTVALVLIIVISPLLMRMAPPLELPHAEL